MTRTLSYQCSNRAGDNQPGFFIVINSEKETHTHNHVYYEKLPRSLLMRRKITFFIVFLQCQSAIRSK